jgi:ATP-dependent Clp protease protease subunit
VNSPGGSVSAGLGIYDMMQFVKCDIVTTCIGLAASMGSLLLTAGTKGKRFIMPHAKVMIHQPLIQGGLSGQASDIEIHAREMIKTKNKLTEIYQHHSGRDFDWLTQQMDRDRYLTAEEAVEFGLVDSIIAPRKGTMI